MSIDLGIPLPEHKGREFLSYYSNWDMIFRNDGIDIFRVHDYAGTMLHKKWSKMVKHVSHKPKAHYGWDVLTRGVSKLALHQAISSHAVTLL